MTKDEKISFVLNKYGAFWAFGDKQFNEQKKENTRYVSLGAGLVCPLENAKNLNKDLNTTLKEIKQEEKEAREKRILTLKNIQMLSIPERIENRKILIREATSRINNFADDCWIAEHYKMIDSSRNDTIIEVIDSLLSAINGIYHDRADYEPEIKEVYDDNIKVIKELQAEIINLIKK